MKRSSTEKKQGTLFSYFNKVKDPAAKKKETLSSLIAKTMIQETTTVTSTTTTTKTAQRMTQSTIDLTEDDDEIDDLEILPSTDSQPISVNSSQGSWSNRNRVQNEEMKNTCKYNNKAWSAKSKEMGPRSSSLDVSASQQQDKQTQRFERLVLKKLRITPKPTYDWLGPDDVKPYSSNYTPYQPDDSIVKIRKPEITINYAGYNRDSESTSSKRGWNDSFGDDGEEEEEENLWESQFSSFNDNSSSYNNSSSSYNNNISSSYTSNKSSSKPGWEDSYGSSFGSPTPSSQQTSRTSSLSSSQQQRNIFSTPSSSSSQKNIFSTPSSSQRSTTSASQQYKAPTYTSEQMFEAAFGTKKKPTDVKTSSSNSTYYGQVKTEKVKMEKFASESEYKPRRNMGFGGFQSFSSSKSNKDHEYRPELSQEQERVLSMVLNERRSLFFTGSAGTGKSVLLRAIIEKLGDRYGTHLAVTASTGIAACNINGCTLHSFGGIGIARESAHDLANKIRRDNRRARDRWVNTKVLVIDEISMVDAELFDKLDEIARILRGDERPFGGMQIIVTGDFFQLPPVNKDRVSKFAFEARAWATAIKQTVMLTKVFRQKDDTFVKMLNEMRLGRLSNETIKIFQGLSRTPPEDDGIEPTELYPLRNEVDTSNKRRLDALKGEVIEFIAEDQGDSRKMESCLAPRVIQLKMDAQVMLLKNMDAELVNGSLGVVVGFAGKGFYRKQDEVNRLRAPQASIGDIDLSKHWPIVKFAGERYVCLEQESWSVEMPGGRASASRRQIPLMLAWAISIHKSQGQTLDRVKVDLGRVFEKGQAYVALSRATNLERLQILNFKPEKVMAHPKVTQFYNSLRTV